MTILGSEHGALETHQSPTSGSPQNNIASAGKYALGEPDKAHTRDWQLYLFFRILKQSEVDALKPLLKSESITAAVSGDLERQLLGQVAGLDSAFKDDPESVDAVGGASETDAPADAFRAWLRLANGVGSAAEPSEAIASYLKTVSRDSFLNILTDGIAAYKTAQSKASALFEKAENSDLGRLVIEQGLVAILVHEFFRHIMLGDGEGDEKDDLAGGVVQAAKPQAALAGASVLRKDRKGLFAKLLTRLGLNSPSYDRASINIGFTFAGLEALKLDTDTLRSFPESFRDGMAARSQRLGDTGIDSPENWYGELGSKRIHGYFTGGFDAQDVSEAAWETVRRQIDIFNTRDPSGKEVRAALRMLFLPFGMEVLHIELGQAPYEIVEEKAKPISQRVEHFGFRDGISQPFVDLNLRADGTVASPPAGGTPARNRTWTPLATGELFLGHPDEDGQIIKQPVNTTLRDNGTYMVFRKLEQDVVGFRNFLAQQRPGDPEAQKRLSAQMVGRWPNGASLVLSPDAERAGSEDRINDFLFTQDDPAGKKCPLGAHIRRTNPRDIGGRNNVRRHRLMRRSMAYGGALLPDGSIGEGRERGMLFFAANSRIDMQFEVVQADWINGGEFLGQAGLGKCPLTGNNRGRTSDAFLEAGKGVPVSGIPAFVRLRGGDYFFLPSGEALRAICDPQNKLSPDDVLIDDGHSFGDSVTEELFSKQRVSKIVRGIAFAGQRAVGVRPPAAAANAGGTTYEGPFDGGDVIFVGTHADVTSVLSSQPQDANAPMPFTAARSRIAGKAMLRTHNLLVGTDWNHPTADERNILSDIANTAWSQLAAGGQGRLGKIISRSLRRTLLRIAPSGHVDLVRDFAADAVYDVVSELFGTPGPDHLTELGVALPFSENRMTQVDRDWLAGLKPDGFINPGLESYKIWSFLVGLNLVGDLKNQQEIERLGAQAAAEALLHLDQLIDRQRARPDPRGSNLLAAMVGIEGQMRSKYPKELPTSDEYYGHVRSLLFELTLTASSIIPAVFGIILDAIFESGQDLGDLIFLLKKAADSQQSPVSLDQALVQLIYEVNRLRPAQPIVMRLCEVEKSLPSGIVIRKDQWVAALVAAANLDGSIFPDPLKLSLAPLFKSHPKRELKNYLMFGVDPGNANLNAPQDALPPRTCWGRDRVAVSVLVACLKAAAGLPGLRRIAGPRGQLQTTLGITSGLIGKFAPFTPT